MELGIILETKEPEKAWNPFRFAITARKQGHAVKAFLMGEAVECEHVHHEGFDVASHLNAFSGEGGQLLACGTCLPPRQPRHRWTRLPWHSSRGRAIAPSRWT